LNLQTLYLQLVKLSNVQTFECTSCPFFDLGEFKHFGDVSDFQSFSFTKIPDRYSRESLFKLSTIEVLSFSALEVVIVKQKNHKAASADDMIVLIAVS
jgi:hypothetical protein